MGRFGVIRDPVTGTPANVETNGGLAVNIQDQHSRALDLHFLRALNSPPTTLTSAITAGDSVISVTNTTSITGATHILCVNADGTWNIAGIISFVADTSVTVDMQLDTSMVVSGTNVLYATNSLISSTAGTVAAPIIYQIAGIGAGTGIDIDITRIMGTITDTTGMDDGMFGGITALTNGIVLRLNNGVVTNLWNAKTNGEIGLLCYDTAYTDKAPAGSNGFKFRNTYAGQAKHGVTLRLEPTDTLEILIQDNLTGLDSFQMMAQGHLVTD